MSENDPVFNENSEDSNTVQASSDIPVTMPAFQTIEIVETQENNQEFVNETASVIDDSNEVSGGSEVETEGPAEVSESENSQDVVLMESDENSKSGKEILNKMCAEDAREVPNQDDDENTTSKSWPTLAILPGGIICPTETEDEYPYCIYIDQPPSDPESEELMYACAKCPMRFKVLNLLTMHIRTHAEDKKKNNGQEAYKKLTKFERRLLVLKKKRIYMETEYKKKQITVMARIARAFARMGPDFLD